MRRRRDSCPSPMTIQPINTQIGGRAVTVSPTHRGSGRPEPRIERTLQTEWILTNGLGGFAMGTDRRRQHPALSRTAHHARPAARRPHRRPAQPARIRHRRERRNLRPRLPAVRRRRRASSRRLPAPQAMRPRRSPPIASPGATNIPPPASRKTLRLVPRPERGAHHLRHSRIGRARAHVTCAP